MATKPIKFLELHYTMTQFLIIEDSCRRKTAERLVTKKKPKEKQRIETARNRQTCERTYFEGHNCPKQTWDVINEQRLL